MKIMKFSNLSALISVLSVVLIAIAGYAAYHHGGDTDSDVFRTVYPNTAGTKLDSCTTCHSGGTYNAGTDAKPKWTTLGSCQWCHYKTDYGKDLSEATLRTTLNSYGIAYRDAWPTADADAAAKQTALRAIEGLNSDGDGYTNIQEIVALTYPGDVNDDPTKVPAPSRVLSLVDIEKMPQHNQFMLMNASKSDDFYTLYSGVALENLIRAIMLESVDSTGITVISPDGFATYHPFEPSLNANVYHLSGVYPEGTFWYNDRANIAIYPADPPNYVNGGWCDYSSPSASGRNSESVIYNSEGLKMMLALKRDGQYLTTGVLNLQNKLDGEGPFRVVPPQKRPGWPDQRSSSKNQDVIWPYLDANDHNAGFASRTVTMIRIEPLPSGTTDINTYEAGWPYVDERKIVIYGAIEEHLQPKLTAGLNSLIASISGQKGSVFRTKSSKTALINKVKALKKQVAHAAYSGALEKLKEDLLKKTDGCLEGAVDANDWVKDLEVQKVLCSQMQQIWIMLVLLGA